MFHRRGEGGTQSRKEREGRKSSMCTDVRVKGSHDRGHTSIRKRSQREENPKRSPLTRKKKKEKILSIAFTEEVVTTGGKRG